MGADGGAAAPGLSGRSLVLLLAATQFLAFSDRFLITLVAQPLKLDLALSDTQLGVLQGSAFAVLNAAAMPWAGICADRGHRRSLLLASVLVWGLATLACGLAGSFAALAVARALLGLGQAAIAPAALSLMAYRLPPAGIGRAISLFTAGATLGRSLALLGGGAALAWLTAAGGLTVPGYGPVRPWQALFALACLPNLALLVGLQRVVEPPTAPARTGRPALAWVLRHRSAYLPHFGAAAAAVLISQTLTAWAPTFYVRAHGLTPATGGLYLGMVILVAAPLGHIAGGRWLDRARARGLRGAASRALALGLALACPSAGVMALASDLTTSLTGFAVLVAALGVTSPPALAGLQILTPRALRGRMSAVFVASVTLVAFGVGPALVGVINDRVVGPENVGAAMFAVFSATALVGIVLALSTRTLRSPRSAARASAESAPP
ncbi:MFS transporter [Methylobacterium sp. J-026]|uniref:MFS transporter n=1 Tax=Methylobacterium sp. J-026 TaxID=2836624 RepID=UPI001FB8FF65|nr:MFS transporter [Methylobacterium sp. J-026]MCJ2137277.1 MFS transporter [Methylobacterium sp. J-026]